MPSGNSGAALVLGKLGRLMMENRYENAAHMTVDTFSAEIMSSPTGFTHMLSAFDYLLGPSKEIVIAGDQNDPNTQAMLREINKHFIPNKVVCFHPPRWASQAKAIEALVPFVKDQNRLNGKTTAYVCQNYHCQFPTNDLDKFKDLLRVH